MRLVLACALLPVLACAARMAQTPEQPAVDAPPNDPGTDAALADGMRVYYLVLLRRGPSWTSEDTPKAREIGAGHMAHIEAMAAAGKLITAGPFLGQTDPRDLAGLYLFDVPSLAAVKALTEADPGVASKRFVAEYLVWAGTADLLSKAADGSAAATSAAADPSAATKTPPCAGNRDFDFWLGHWQVRDSKGTVVGHNRIEKVEDGCVLVERWKSARGGTGTSMNYVDPVTREWVQLWVDASGGVIHLRGKLVEGSMSLAGNYVTGKGVTSKLRGRWTPNADGSVRQHFEESKDSGKTWKTWFDGTYSRTR